MPIRESAAGVKLSETWYNMVVATVPVEGTAAGVAVTADGTHAYVAIGNSSAVQVIDTASNTVVGTPIPVGPGPVAVAVTPDGKHVYVSNESAIPGTVSVIDTATNTVEPMVIMVGNEPNGIAITPDGKHAYVTNYNDNTSR